MNDKEADRNEVLSSQEAVSDAAVLPLEDGSCNFVWELVDGVRAELGENTNFSPDDTVAITAEAHALLMEKNYEEAIDRLFDDEKHEPYFPKSLAALTTLALAYQGLGQSAQACAVLSYCHSSAIVENEALLACAVWALIKEKKESEIFIILSLGNAAFRELPDDFVQSSAIKILTMIDGAKKYRLLAPICQRFYDRDPALLRDPEFAAFFTRGLNWKGGHDETRRILTASLHFMTNLDCVKNLLYAYAKLGHFSAASRLLSDAVTAYGHHISDFRHIMVALRREREHRLTTAGQRPLVRPRPTKPLIRHVPSRHIMPPPLTPSTSSAEPL